MLVFLDFEASSLSDASYPIEVGWVDEGGRSESHLIRPAPGWTDWNPAAEAIHHIAPDLLFRDGRPHDEVAGRMIEALSGHDLLASAPSWDGKWLSVLLRASGFPRHALRLRKSGLARREAARAILTGILSPETIADEVERIVSSCEAAAGQAPPAHRALADAQAERALWLSVRQAASDVAARLASSERP